MKTARILMVGSAILFAASQAMAQEVEATASEEETTSAVAAIEPLGCDLAEGGAVEKESDTLFEIDDAACLYGQFDIKLDGAFAVTSVTYDGPIDADAEEMTADEVTGEEIEDFVGEIGCRVEEDEVEMEAENLFEIDDADCESGQFDIKIERVDGQLLLRSMTRD